MISDTANEARQHSGRHAHAAHAPELGHLLEGENSESLLGASSQASDQLDIVDMSRSRALITALENRPPEEPWTLSKIEIRAPVSATAWPVARVELEHASRGRVTDLASAPGGLDAAFAAVGQIIGVSGRVKELEIRYDATDPAAAGGDMNVLVQMRISVDGETFAGSARARDVLPCCVAAYIDAARSSRAPQSINAKTV
jgi:2-isopropylmalate synthase